MLAGSFFSLSQFRQCPVVSQLLAALRAYSTVRVVAAISFRVHDLVFNLLGIHSSRFLMFLTLYVFDMGQFRIVQGLPCLPQLGVSRSCSNS